MRSLLLRCIPLHSSTYRRAMKVSFPESPGRRHPLSSLFSNLVLISHLTPALPYLLLSPWQLSALNGKDHLLSFYVSPFSVFQPQVC